MDDETKAARDIWRTSYVPALIEISDGWAWSGRRRLSRAAIERLWPEAEAVAIMRAAKTPTAAVEQLEPWLDLRKDAWLWRTRASRRCRVCRGG